MHVFQAIISVCFLYITSDHIHVDMFYDNSYLDKNWYHENIPCTVIT